MHRQPARTFVAKSLCRPCRIMTGAGAVFNTAKVRRHSSVAVVGLGGVGLSAVMAAREVGRTHRIDAREADAAQRVMTATPAKRTQAPEGSHPLTIL